MNKCGECNICCDIFTITELNKDAHVVCKYYDKECKIYSDRPESCRNFTCEYIKRNWNIRLRPDRCGIVVHNDSGKRYHAVRFQDDIDSLIMEQIEFMKKEYDVVIKRMDVTRKRKDK